ncbi:MAG: peptidoglycan-associated lipoprotein Pal [Victivallales bacterium]
MDRFFKLAVFAVLLTAMVTGSGCSTMARWFGWGDSDETAQTAGNIPPPNGLTPGEFGAPGGLPPGGRPEWKPIPGMTLPTVYFAYDQSTIGTTEQAKLEQVANILLQQKDVNLIIEGNCDERGSIEYNRGLGERRALAVKAYLTKLGLADARMQTISYGSERPAAQGHDEAAWAKNRRADLIGAR